MKTMRPWLRVVLILLSFLSIARMAHGEDIDLFAGATATGTEDAPNVLIVLDNTANWNTAFANEKAALLAAVGGLPLNKFKVGLMMYTETGGGNTGADGGYIRSAIRLLDADYQAKLLALLESIDINADKSNGGKASQAMREAYLYLDGGTPYSGNNKNKTDYAGNVSGTTQSKAIYSLAGNALNAKNGSTYNKPTTEGCGGTYIIYISNGAPQDNNADRTSSRNALAALGGDTSVIPVTPAASQDSVADEWARFMYGSPLAVTTYTIDVNKVTNGQGPNWTAQLQSMARVSQGKYFDVVSEGSQILDALNAAFSEIQAVNSVFASVSLPVSVNTQGTYLNQVFIGMFRPDADGAPRWNGNLKQYRIGRSGDNLRLEDAAAASAINNQTGFITECARSFWTPTAVDNYWSFQPMGDCLTVAGSKSSNSPDGNIVEKGAQAYRLRSITPSARTVYTCNPGVATCDGANALASYVSGNTTGITSARLGVTATERTNLINWSRGLDTDKEKGVASTAMRPSVHGDVVHSRPVAINYGTDASPQVVVFYGANDGMLRAVNGNRTADIGATPAGGEMWAFMPPEFYGKVDRLRQNELLINFPNMTGGAPKPYGMDGPITAYRSGSASATTYLYGAMRRGGRMLYAFDVTTPATPTFKWMRGCDIDGVCTTGFADIGQTWSSAKTAMASGYGGGSSPLLVMGGGYDTCEDSDPHNCGASPKGARIYVMDANTGALLKTFSTLRSVVGDVNVLTDPSTGLATYIYAADTGGNVYRINVGTAAPGSWTMTQIASLGCATPTVCSPHRKFLFSPDVVVEGDTNIILMGSGDREKPLESYTSAASVQNYFFMLQDKPTDSAWLTEAQGGCVGSLICLTALHSITGSTNPTADQLSGKKGWYLAMSSKEQVVTSSVTVFGTVTFGTHQPTAPAANSCKSNLGLARVYNIAYLDASIRNGTTSRSETLPAGGLSPSPVAGKVILDDGTSEVFIIGSSPNSPLDAKKPGSLPGFSPQPRRRVYWNILK